MGRGPLRTDCFVTVTIFPVIRMGRQGVRRLGDTRGDRQENHGDLSDSGHVDNAARLRPAYSH